MELKTVNDMLYFIKLLVFYRPITFKKLNWFLQNKQKKVNFQVNLRRFSLIKIKNIIYSKQNKTLIIFLFNSNKNCNLYKVLQTSVYCE